MWEAMGRQLRNPEGLGGRLTGKFMRVVNRTPNRLAVDALDLAPEDVALDLGCGPGHALALMAARAATVHGMDQSETMLGQAAQANRLAVREGRVVLARGEFDRLPYPTGMFDKILASNVMYFWKNAPGVLAEIRRVMRLGGRLSIYVTDARTMRQWKFAGPDTHRLFDADALRILLRRGGFENDRITLSPVRLSGGIHGLLATAETRPLQSNP